MDGMQQSERTALGFSPHLLPTSDPIWRRRLLAMLMAPIATAVLGRVVHAQERQPLIVVLMHGKESASGGRLESLIEGLRDSGYILDQNYRLAVRWSDNHVERLPLLARELLAKQPAVAVASPVLSAQALQRESKTVPIVMANGAGAQRVGLIASLARPGGNVTGLENQLDELSAKQFELLRELAPNARRVMALSSGLGAAEPDIREGSRAAAKAYGISLIEAFADTPAKMVQVSALCEREKCQALVVLLDPNLQGFRSDILAMAWRSRIPAAYPLLEYAQEGGLVAYSTAVEVLFRRAASYVSKILKGATPADLPIERPTKFELVINLKTAKALNLTVPQSLLVRADQVIE
jgi:putative ABC transport system substrate-binding protein